ncbi:PREDICTED: replication protein A 32 kDa subunit isoform X2 [Rhagoletis zephyria]|uniref:replication protein A 32 kDa subunit isoform X2 n=1 Tax=Rhagoletis zephyria TaxID=28612 RepID=UPI0008114D45|nr:PREDICTED: replication protein A 32 kDa subunit isoform X2 [Rhagoletis zephyria]
MMDISVSGTSASAQNVSQGGSSAEGIAPVFIKQILLSQEGNFKMFDMAFGMITSVAMVRSVDISSTKITYTLEDHSGQIEAHYWLEEGDSLKCPDVMLNNYVRLYGSVRTQGHQKMLMIFKMIAVMNSNEICTHILEVLNARLKSEEFAKCSDQMISINIGAIGFNPSDGDGSSYLGLEGKQLAVLQAVKNNMTTEGIGRKELQLKFNHISANEINAIIEFLISEGHIYSSFDADHFPTQSSSPAYDK